jgi:hypothetical protein
MLLERLQPGTPLIPLALGDDEAATRLAAQVMQQLWRPAPADHPFPTVADWGRGFERLRAEFNGRTGPFPAKLVDTAEQLFADLLASADLPFCSTATCTMTISCKQRGSPGWPLTPKGWWANRPTKWARCCETPSPTSSASRPPIYAACKLAAWTSWPKCWLSTGSGSGAGRWPRPSSPPGGATRMASRAGRPMLRLAEQVAGCR